MAVTAVEMNRGVAAERLGHRRAALAVKRVLDVVAASLALLVLLPVFLVIASTIALIDGRPVFFGQTRVGRDGRPFRMYKFRTMATDAERRRHELDLTNDRSGPIFKINDDPRVTRTGRVLRRSSLDELPQFLNVLLGQMSMVGPRPALPEEVAQFPTSLRRRESLPQGITGLWQIEGRTDASFRAYAELDLRYVRDWSLWMDLRILVRTPFVVLRQAWDSRAVRDDHKTAVAATESPSALVSRLVAAEASGGLELTLDLRDPTNPTVDYVIDLREPQPAELPSRRA